MLSKKIIIKNPTGLHVRPAGVLCNTAMNFKSSVTFSHDTTSTNAKSLLSVLAARIKCGDEITLICEGEDEQEAFETVASVIESGLGE